MIAAAPTIPDPNASLAEARHSVRQLVIRSSSSFAVAMRFMPPQRRQAMYAVYAFARVVDDIADSSEPAEERSSRLMFWKREVERIFTGTPTTPIGLALSDAVTRFGLPRREFELLIEGMEMDCRGAATPPSLERLLAYTRRVAGTVGLLSMRIFGAGSTAAADRFALSLADALQLTNILRDVREDAERGRVYLPVELLQAHGVRSTNPREIALHPRVAGVCADLGSIARGRFKQARAAMTALQRRRIRAALMMMGVYEGYLEQLEQRRWAMSGPPVFMGKAEKLVRSLRYAVWLPGTR